jgi:hypothetical protein
VDKPVYLSFLILCVVAAVVAAVGVAMLDRARRKWSGRYYTERSRLMHQAIALNGWQRRALRAEQLLQRQQADQAALRERAKMRLVDPGADPLRTAGLDRGDLA